MYFMPVHNGLEQPKLLSTITLMPFNKNQIRSYLSLYYEKQSSDNTALTLDTFDKVDGLSELITSPFLLYLAVECLPDLLSKFQVTSKDAKQLAKITQTKIQEVFIDKWFSRQALKLSNSGLLATAGRSVDEMKQMFWNYCQSLALEMHNHDLTWLSTADERFEAYFDTSDLETQLLLSACPLQKKNNMCSFWHQSFGTFFVSQTVIREETKVHQEKAANNVPEGIVENEQPTGTLHFKLITENVDLLRSFADDIKSDPAYKKCLFRNIELSKTNKSYAIGAANSITALNFAGVSLSGFDFSNICIRYAQLNGALLHGTNLSGADLTGVNFDQAALSCADLRGAILTDAIWGEIPSLMTMAGEALSSLTLSKDGSIVATGGVNGHLQVWNYLTGDKLHTIQATEGSIVVDRWQGDCTKTVSISPDNAWIATAGGFILGDYTVRVWDVKTGLQQNIFRHHIKCVQCVVFHLNSKWLASAGQDGIIVIVDVISSDVVFSVGSISNLSVGHTVSLLFSVDGEYLLSGAHSTPTITVWNIATKTAVHSFKNDAIVANVTAVMTMAFNSSGRMLATSHANCFTLWNFSSRELMECFEASKSTNDYIMSLDFSPDSNYVVSSSLFGKIQLWNVQEKNLSYELADVASQCHGIRFHPYVSSEGQYTVLGAVLETSVRSWKFYPQSKPTASKKTKFHHVNQINCMSLCLAKNWMLTGGTDGIILWDLNTFSVIHQVTDNFMVKQSDCVAMNVSGSYFAYRGSPFMAMDTTTIFVCNAQDSAFKTDSLILSDNILMVTVGAIEFVPSGDKLVTATGGLMIDRSIAVWDVVTRTLLFDLKDSLPQSAGKCSALKFGRGNILAAGTEKGMIYVWQANNLRNLQSVLVDSFHKKLISELSFNGTGTLLASASYDGTASVCDTSTGELKCTITPPKRDNIRSERDLRVYSVKFSPDDSVIVVGTFGMFLIWDLKSSSIVSTVEGHADMVTSVVFLSSNQVITTSYDSVMRLWLGDNAFKKVTLQWRSHSSSLSLIGCNYTDAVGLQPTNRQLFVQSRAIDSNSTEVAPSLDTKEAVDINDPRNAAMKNAMRNMMMAGFNQAMAMQWGYQPELFLHINTTGYTLSQLMSLQAGHVKKLAQECEQEKQYSEAIAHDLTLMSYWANLHGGPNVDAAETLYHLGKMNYLLKKSSDARMYFVKALHELRRCKGPAYVHEQTAIGIHEILTIIDGEEHPMEVILAMSPEADPVYFKDLSYEDKIKAVGLGGLFRDLPRETPFTMPLAMRPTGPSAERVEELIQQAKTWTERGDTMAAMDALNAALSMATNDLHYPPDHPTVLRIQSEMDANRSCCLECVSVVMCCVCWPLYLVGVIGCACCHACCGEKEATQPSEVETENFSPISGQRNVMDR